MSHSTAEANEARHRAAILHTEKVAIRECLDTMVITSDSLIAHINSFIGGLHTKTKATSDALNYMVDSCVTQGILPESLRASRPQLHVPRLTAATSTIHKKHWARGNGAIRLHLRQPHYRCGGGGASGRTSDA